MKLTVADYAPSLLTRPRIQPICAIIVIAGSLLPWAMIPPRAFNFMYLAGMESGLEVAGRYTLIAGMGALVLESKSTDRPGIRFALRVIAGLTVVVSLVWILRVSSSSGFSPAAGAFLTLFGGLGLLTAELANLR